MYLTSTLTLTSTLLSLPHCAVAPLRPCAIVPLNIGTLFALIEKTTL
jgi:hypothetical protein